MMSKWGPSDFAAWWGAALASIVFVWDVIKHFRSGPKLKIIIKSRPENRPPVIDVSVTNIGDDVACIEHMNLNYYRKLLFFKKKVAFPRIFTMYLIGTGHGAVISIDKGNTIEMFVTRDKESPSFYSTSPGQFDYLAVELHEAHKHRPSRQYISASLLYE